MARKGAAYCAAKQGFLGPAPLNICMSFVEPLVDRGLPIAGGRYAEQIIRDTTFQGVVDEARAGGGLTGSPICLSKAEYLGSWWSGT